MGLKESLKEPISANSLSCAKSLAVQFPRQVPGIPSSLESWYRYMNEVQSNRWLELCERATKEQDPHKLQTLVEELDRLLEVQETQLRAARAGRR